jgi:hypothetical protein
MNIPMLVVHGVNNRDRFEFEKTVSALQSRLGNTWHLIPVYWGDLGGKTEGLFDTLFDISSSTRSEETDYDWATLLSITYNQSSQQIVRSEEARLDFILQGISETSDIARVRSLDKTSELAPLIREELPKTKVIQHIEQPELLIEIGKMLAGSLSEEISLDSSLFATRTEVQDDLLDFEPQTRFSLEKEKGQVRVILQSLDRFVGKMLDNILGQLNQNLRRFVGIQFVNFFGDIFAYQGEREKFHQRLHQAIDSHAPGWGQENRPISILAHSLGGVLSFDSALIGESPLWIDNFITFGSQSSFFHVVDPRKNLPTYAPQQPVVLPNRIRKWYNLWEPLDFLAFNAERIFRLSGGETPKDIPVFSPASRILREKGITHGVYWESDELLEVLQNCPLPND